MDARDMVVGRDIAVGRMGGGASGCCSGERTSVCDIMIETLGSWLYLASLLPFACASQRATCTPLLGRAPANSAYSALTFLLHVAVHTNERGASRP